MACVLRDRITNPISPQNEFNQEYDSHMPLTCQMILQTDPEAAAIVFNSGANVTMVPLQVTHTAVATQDILSRISAGPARGAEFLRIVIDMLTFFAATYHTVFSFPDPPIHDPCAVAFALRPELFKVGNHTNHLMTCWSVAVISCCPDIASCFSVSAALSFCYHTL